MREVAHKLRGVSAVVVMRLRSGAAKPSTGAGNVWMRRSAGPLPPNRFWRYPHTPSPCPPWPRTQPKQQPGPRGRMDSDLRTYDTLAPKAVKRNPTISFGLSPPCSGRSIGLVGGI